MYTDVGLNLPTLETLDTCSLAMEETTITIPSEERNNVDPELITVPQPQYPALNVRRSTRTVRRPNSHQDYILCCNTMQYDHIAKNYMCFFGALDKDVEPKTIE